MPSSASISSGPITSMQSGSRRHPSIGSASTLSSDASTRALASASAPGGSSRNSRAGMCSPNSVSVCTPAACSSADRIDGSASEWQ